MEYSRQPVRPLLNLADARSGATAYRSALAPTRGVEAAGRAYLARLRQRADAFVAEVGEAAWRAMLSAASDVGTPETSLLRRVGAITHPTLVANGNEDAMIPTFQSYALAQAMPNARLVIYPDSGHAFMFQYPQTFGDEVVRFLEADATA